MAHQPHPIVSFLFLNKERMRDRAHFDESGRTSFELAEIDYSRKDDNAWAKTN